MSDLDFTTLPKLDKLGHDRLKLLLHGEPGSGKTTLAGSIAELGPTLYVDLPGEKGMGSLAGVPYAKNLTVFRPTSVGEIDEAFWKLQSGDHPFQAVVVEGVSAWHSMYVRYFDGLEEAGVRQKRRGQEAPRKRDGRQVYGEANDALKDDMIFWYGLADATAEKPVHVVMTSQTRSRETYEGSADWRLGPAVSPGALRTVEAVPDFIGFTFVEREGAGEMEFDLGGGGDVTPESYRWCVRFGPHDQIMTKTHEAITAAKRWPSVVGRDGKRLTLPKFMAFMGITPT